MRERISIIDRIKSCCKSWLLPHPFKIVGQVLLLVILIALAVQIIATHIFAIGDAMSNPMVQSAFRRVVGIVV